MAYHYSQGKPSLFSFWPSAAAWDRAFTPQIAEKPRF
jgi:hypothetical protein